MELDFTLLRAQCEDQYKYLLGFLNNITNMKKIFSNTDIKASQKLKLVDYVLANEKVNILCMVNNRPGEVRSQP